MQNKAPTVYAYLNGVPADRRPALERMRQLYRKHLTGFEEGMVYGGPCYS